MVCQRVLGDLACCVKAILTAVVPMANRTQEEAKIFRSAEKYHVCEKSFGPKDTRMRDHCHLIDRYRREVPRTRHAI